MPVTMGASRLTAAIIAPDTGARVPSKRVLDEGKERFPLALSRLPSAGAMQIPAAGASSQACLLCFACSRSHLSFINDQGAAQDHSSSPRVRVREDCKTKRVERVEHEARREEGVSAGSVCAPAPQRLCRVWLHTRTRCVRRRRRASREGG